MVLIQNIAHTGDVKIEIFSTDSHFVYKATYGRKIILQ